MKQKIFTSVTVFLALALMAAVQGITFTQEDSQSNDDIDQIKSELSSKTVSYDFKETKFREVINRIRQQVSFNIIISDKVDQLLGQGGNAENQNNQGGNQFGGDSQGDNGGFGGSSGDSSGGFGSSSSGGNSGGFGSSGSSGNSGGGFGSSGGNDGNSSGGFGNSSGGGGGGFGSSGNSSSGGFGSSDSGGGFGSSGGNSGGGFGSSGGSSGFGSGGGGAGGQQPVKLDNKVTIKLDNVTIMRALKLILNQKRLTAVFKLGAVHIVPKDEAQNYDIRFYDVRDLQYKLKDFKSKVTKFHHSGGYKSGSESGGKSGSSSGQFLNNQMFGSKGGSSDKEIITNEKEFMKLIKNNVGSQEDWQGKASMRMTNGILVVNQTSKVHGEIDFLINRLRQFK